MINSPGGVKQMNLIRSTKNVVDEFQIRWWASYSIGWAASHRQAFTPLTAVSEAGPGKSSGSPGAFFPGS
jgi:hypothetical protein